MILTRSCLFVAAGFLVVGLVTSAGRAADDVAAVESRFLSNPKQITTRFSKAGEGYFAPDGQSIIFQAAPPGYPFYQIYTQSFDGGAPRLVSTGRGRTTCSYFAPDGKSILFASSHLDPDLHATENASIRQEEEDRKAQRRPRYKWDFDPATEIFTADVTGGNLKRLTDSPGYDAEGAYSRDGKLIAFCSDRDGDPDIYVMNADGTNVRQLTNAPGYDGGPFISPDGKWVVFRSDRTQAEHLQLYVIGIDGKNEQPLTSDLAWVNWGPYWHPTAPYIIWSGADHSQPGRPNYDLWLMKYSIDGGKFIPGEKHRVTAHPSADVLPVFSPDGKRLMWTSNRTEDHTSQLWIADFKLPE